MLVVCCFEAGVAQAQENLDAGKSPSQLFAGTCTACHKSPRGLLKTVAPGSLPGFLRQHYTTSPEMAGVLSSYLVSNGASDTRYMGGSPKGGKDGKDGAKEAKSDAKPDDAPSSIVDQLDRFGRRLRSSRSAPEPTESRETKSEPETAGPQNELSPRAARNARRLARRTHDAKPDGEAQEPTSAAGEHRADGRKSAGKQKLSKRGKRAVEEPAKPDAAREEPADAVKLDAPKGETAKTDAKPAVDDRPEPAQADVPKESESPALRADPAPPVTPPPPVTTQSISGSTGDSTGSVAAPPPVTAAAPPSGPTVSPAGPPEPPISH
jgi:hypothetical protein